METNNKIQFKTYQFKTNIHCGGCVANVTPELNKTEGIKHWEVDTASAGKILTVKAESISESDVIKAVQKAGYKAESIS
jgi:copper chaperone